MGIPVPVMEIPEPYPLLMVIATTLPSSVATLRCMVLGAKVL